jgi:2'-5' RNA ligase
MENNQFKRMQKLAGIITEEKQTYDYGCAMLYFNFPEMNKIHDAINPNDVYTQEGDRSFGFETEPHCTLLYGLHEGVTTEDVEKVLDKYTYYTCKAHNASLFENPEYDVLKFDIKGDNLHETNADLQQYPFTSNFPDYHPHMTIAYLKPGSGKRYVQMLKGVEFDLAPQYAVYSKPNGDKDKINIRID